MAIKPLSTHYSMENFPTVYDEEAMTVLKLVGRSDGKVNELVEAFNGLESKTTQQLANQFKAINTMNNETMPAKVVSEVNKAVNDGTFDRAIDGRYGDLESRVDTLLGTVPAGGTSMDAEVIDGRMDETGVNHVNLGDNIRSGVSRSVNAMGRYMDRNKLNPNTTTGGYITDAGVFTASEDYQVSDFIPLEAGETVALFSNSMNVCQMRFITAYDKDKNVLAGYGKSAVHQFRQSDNVAFIRVSISADFWPVVNLMLARPSATKFEPYFRRDGHNMNGRPDCYQNLFNPEGITQGHYIDQSGTLKENPDYYVSNYIPVEPFKTYRLWNKNMQPVQMRFHALYDGFASSVIQGGSEAYEVKIPDGCFFIRFCTLTANGTDLMFAESGCHRFLGVNEWCAKDAVLPAPLYNNGMPWVANLGTITGVENTNNNLMNQLPWYTRKNTHIHVFAKFDTFKDLYVNRNNSIGYGLGVRVNNTDVKVYVPQTGETKATFPTNMSIKGFISLTLSTDDKGIMTITVSSVNGMFTCQYNCENTFMGYLGVGTTGTLKDVRVAGSCSDLRKPVWVIGDSYSGLSGDRVTGQLIEMGFNNFMLTGIGGLASPEGYDELERCLLFGKPNVLVWYLGMNDMDVSVFNHYVLKLKDLCKARDITLVLNRVPTVPEYSKEAHSQTVLSSGCRYIDSYSAVGTDASGNWVNEMLSDDGVHPNWSGARALAGQMLADVPELLTY